MANRYKPVEDIRGHMPPKELAARKDAEQALFTFKPLIDQPPAWLDDTAVKEWRRIVPLIKADVPVSELDAASIASYCQAYSDVQTAQAEIDASGTTIETATGGVRANPAVKMKRDAVAQMVKLADELGLTVYSRLKMQIKGGGKKPADPFAELVNGR